MTNGNEAIVNWLKNEGYTEIRKDNPQFLEIVNSFCNKYGVQILNEIDMDFSGD